MIISSSQNLFLTFHYSDPQIANHKELLAEYGEIITITGISSGG